MSIIFIKPGNDLGCLEFLNSPQSGFSSQHHPNSSEEWKLLMNFVLLTNPVATSQSSSCFISHTVYTAAFITDGHVSLKHFLCLPSRIPRSPVPFTGCSFSASLVVSFLPPRLLNVGMPQGFIPGPLYPNFLGFHPFPCRWVSSKYR